EQRALAARRRSAPRIDPVAARAVAVGCLRDVPVFGFSHMNPRAMCTSLHRRKPGPRKARRGVHTQPKIPLAGLDPAIYVLVAFSDLGDPRRGCPEQVRARGTYSCIATRATRSYIVRRGEFGSGASRSLPPPSATLVQPAQ